MAKKLILYPLIKETTYYPFDSDWYVEQGLAGTPWNVKGSLLDVVYNYSENIEFVENKEFEETLTYIGYSRGRSSAVFRFKDSTDAVYQVFMTDMDDLLRSKDLADGKVTGTWTYCKRGKSYGLRLVESECKSKD